MLACLMGYTWWRANGVKAMTGLFGILGDFTGYVFELLFTVFLLFSDSIVL
jgi:hypothetical protein